MNGCYNRKEFVSTSLLRDGADSHHRPIYHWFNNTSTKECQYTSSALGLVDKGCEGCKHKFVPKTP